MQIKYFLSSNNRRQDVATTLLVLKWNRPLRMQGPEKGLILPFYCPPPSW